MQIPGCAFFLRLLGTVFITFIQQCAIFSGILCMILGRGQSTGRYANTIALPTSQSFRSPLAAKNLVRSLRHAGMSVIDRDQLVQSIQTSPEQTIRELKKHQGEDIRLNSPNVQVSNLIRIRKLSHGANAQPHAGGLPTRFPLRLHDFHDRHKSSTRAFLKDREASMSLSSRKWRIRSCSSQAAV